MQCAGGARLPYESLNTLLDFYIFMQKKVEFIHQEIFARMIMYNFTELIVSHVITENKNRKYAYQANFSIAVHICRQYFCENVSPPAVETLIARLILSIRPGRNLPRNLSPRKATNFL